MIQSKVPLITALPADLRRVATTETFEAGAFVFRTGEPVRGVFVVECGEVRLLRYGRGGSEIVLQRAAPGDFFAEASLDSRGYRCYAVSARPTRLLMFPKERLLSMFASDGVFAAEWIALLSRQLHDTRARLERVSLKTAEERVLHYLHTEGRGAKCEVTVTTNMKDLARELGITHEALYRTLARLQAQRVIRRADKRLELS